MRQWKQMNEELSASDAVYQNHGRRTALKPVFECYIEKKVKGISRKMSSQEVAIEVQGSLREDLVGTAVNFLNNPKVTKSSRTEKENFLRKKGLTNKEIRIAFERSKSSSTTLPFKHDAHAPYPMQNVIAQMSWFQRFKDIALLIGASYGLYYVYKVYIAPFFFNYSKKPNAIESSINEIKDAMQKSIEELTGNVNRVHIELERVLSVQSEQQNFIREIGSLKSEIATLKGILLSRHQFPTVSLSTTSIPAWQLTSSSHKGDKEMLEGEDVEHNSGSSEPEIAPASNGNGGSQGSDSSLEMIKEVDG